MKNRIARWWLGSVAGVSALVLAWGGIAGAVIAQSAADSPLGKPTAMDPDAVTLELHFNPPVAQGTFHPIRAQITAAEAWAGGPRGRADLQGFSGLPGPKAFGPPVLPWARGLKDATSVFVTLKPQRNAVLEVATAAGKAAIRLDDIAPGKPGKYFDKALTVRRLPAATTLAVSDTDNDYPAAARGRDGSIWVAFVAYKSGVNPDMDAAKQHQFDSLVPHGNGDQIRLLHFDGRAWSAPIAVTEPLLDLWKPTVAVDGSGKVWVAWGQNVGGNWDICRRRYDPAAGTWSPIERITSEPGADVNVVSTTDGQGNVWWAWQGRRGKHFQIFLTKDGADAKPIAVTNNAANHWDPAIAADSKGNVYVAWDSYENGNYDVFMRQFPASGQAGAVIPVAVTANYETRVSLAVDGHDRVWIGYEQGGPNWGKDYGRMVPVGSRTTPQEITEASIPYGAGAGRPNAKTGDGIGMPLYNLRRVMVKCYTEGHLQQPAADPAAAWGELPRADKGPTSFARVAVAGDGRVWLFFRHHPLPGGGRENWAEYAMPYDGEAWGKPQMLTNSDNLLDNRPALLPFGDHGILAVYSSDCRLRGTSNQEKDGLRPLKNDLYATLLRGVGPVAPPSLTAAQEDTATVKPVHPNEPQDIQRLRDFRVSYAGKTYQLVRGEFHRHTEYTAHSDVDGALEDMWRYSQDAADMDWMGNADHDNGFGHQYCWWIIQQTMDIYHNPPWFTAPYTYERSVSYPDGHRNVIFARRGIRPLPRGDMHGDESTGTPDTKMLYAYLKQFGGICASHTSGTGMGTDWRDNDPLVEPVVEIYQGDRNNYECDGAPRGQEPRDATDALTEGERQHPKGFVWNALAKGYRLGFECSSDHISTHSSYGVALVDKPGREALIEAFRARRCYAATDNILLLVKCAGHLMGEEFSLAGKPTLDIHAVGTGPIAKLDIVCNNRYVYSAAPNTASVDMQWTDSAPAAGDVNYYYVRIQQADTNLAWSSPMWIHPQGK